MLKYFNHKKRKRGQSTLEYAILIIIIIGALLSVQVYIKRSVQGRLKSAADDIGDQYSDGNVNMVRTTKTHSKSREVFANGATTSTMVDNETTNVSMSMNLINSQQEYWGSK